MQLQTTSPESRFPNEYIGVIFIQIDQHLKKLFKTYNGFPIFSNTVYTFSLTAMGIIRSHNTPVNSFHFFHAAVILSLMSSSVLTCSLCMDYQAQVSEVLHLLHRLPSYP